MPAHRRSWFVAMLLGGASLASHAGSADLPVAPVRGIALRGTMVSSDPAYSRAIIAFGGGDERMVGIGAELPQLGVLTAVETRRIVVSRGGALYEFRFNDSDVVAPGAGMAATSVPLPTIAPAPGVYSGVTSISADGTVHDNGAVNWDDMSKRPKPVYKIQRDPVTGRAISVTRHNP